MAGLRDLAGIRRGQAGIEAVFVATMTLVAYSLVMGYAADLAAEAAERNADSGRDVLCRDIATVVDAVYSGGPGAQTELYVGGNYTVVPWLIVGAGNASDHCSLSEKGVPGPTVLAPGWTRISNRGGFIVFE
jgi:hypothetical protein